MIDPNLIEQVMAAETGWTVPEPVYEPQSGSYICKESDGDRVRELIAAKILLLVGKIPGDRALTLREMLDFRLRM